MAAPARLRSVTIGIAALLAVLPAAGCGDGGSSSSAARPANRLAAGGGGMLGYALPAIPGELDPLRATSSEAQLITLQEHEPLVARLDGPYGDNSGQPGLATSLRPSQDGTVWTVALRRGVRFHDGTPFNAAAVVANAHRWISLPEGRALLPSVFAADAPRPDVVRFVLREPTPKLPAQLSSPRLGIVSPEALRPHTGVGARVAGNLGGPGTGPFQLSHVAAGQIGLARYAAWWGGPLGLGPALDGVDFRAVAAEPRRLALLRSGNVEVAEGLKPAAIAEVRHDPLLTALPGGIGLQRSVRGIDSTQPQPLSGVWLTTVQSAAP